MTIEMKGRLDRDSLDEVFSILLGDDVACSFLVSDGVSEKIFYFAIGGIRMVSLGGRKGVPLGEILVKNGVVTPADRDRGLEHAKARRMRTAEALMDMGLVSQEDVDSGLRAQLEGELCDLFFWNEAEYEFREGQPPPEFYDDRYRALSISCGVADFIRSVRSRREGWASIRKHIPSDRDIFELTPKGEAVLDGGSTTKPPLALAYVDGELSVCEIQRELNWPAIDVYEALYLLLETRLVRKRWSAGHSSSTNRRGPPWSGTSSSARASRRPTSRSVSTGEPPRSGRRSPAPTGARAI